MLSEISEVVSQILPFVFVVVGIALIWFVVELAITIRKARGTIDSLEKQVEPTLTNVETITTQIQPVIAKADPLVDRVTLTLDAANLELVRIDKILEDVGDITDSASSATTAVEGVVNAPKNLVTSASNAVHRAFNGGASIESKRLGHNKAKAAKAASDGEVAAYAADARANIETRAVGAVMPEEPSDEMTKPIEALAEEIIESMGAETVDAAVDAADAAVEASAAAAVED